MDDTKIKIWLLTVIATFIRNLEKTRNVNSIAS